MTSVKPKCPNLPTDTNEKIDFATEIDITNVFDDDDDAEKIVKKRKSYNFTFKMDSIDQVDSGILPVDIAFHNNLDKSLVTLWVQKRQEIIDGASNKHCCLLKKNSKYKKHDDVFNKLHPMILDFILVVVHKGMYNS